MNNSITKVDSQTASDISEGFGLDTVLFPNENEDACPISKPHIVIFANAETNRVFAMNLEEALKPHRFGYAELLSDIESRVIIKGSLDFPKHMSLPDIYWSEKELTKRDQKLKIINPVLDKLEDFLISRSYGSELIKKAQLLAKDSGIKVQRTEIYSLLYRYFQSGCRVNCFLRKPGTGVSTNKSYQNKTGPKRNEGKGSNGRMRTPKDDKNIITIINKHVKVRSPKSLPKAYIELLDAYYSDPLYDENSGEKTEYVHWEGERSVSYDQFKYFANRYINEDKNKIREAQGKLDSFNKDEAGLKGTIKEIFADGPGHYYQIDETPLDIELVSEFDSTRQLRVGKPTCYSVVDMYSTAWVGLLLTMNKSSAHTASEIMFIAFRDKEKFCNEIGVKLNQPWPMKGKCRSIIVDNAEFASELIRTFTRDAQIDIIYNKEGNSQQKGAVERKHKTIEDFLYGMLPGVGRAIIDEYLKRHLRKDALLNLRELYQVLIDFVTTYNNYYPNERIQLTKEMRSDKVARIAAEKWDWGVTYRAGYLRPVEESELYTSLQEIGEVTVKRDHLFLPGKYFRSVNGGKTSKGMKYICDWTQEKGLQDQQKGRSSPRLSCRFMRYSMDRILIETPDGFKPARLHPDEIMFKHMPGEDIQLEKNKLASEERHQNKVYDQKQSRTRVTAKSMICNAKKEQETINAHQANSQDLSENRSIATDFENNLSAQKHEQILDKVYPSSAVEPEIIDNQLSSEPLLTSKANETTQIIRDKRKNKRLQRGNKK